MPTYDYRCHTTDRVVEVKHPMSVEIRTWGELCHYAEIDLGDTPAHTPVEKLVTGGQVVKSSSLKDSAPPACGMGACGACTYN